MYYNVLHVIQLVRDHIEVRLEDGTLTYWHVTQPIRAHNEVRYVISEDGTVTLDCIKLLTQVTNKRL